MGSKAEFEAQLETGEVHEFSLDTVRLLEPLYDAVFTDCTFTDVEFICEEITQCKFLDCTFLRCKFNSLKIADCSFEQCRFYDQDSEQGCEFRFSSFAGTTFRQCDLSMNNFSRSNLYRTEIRNCQAQGSDMSHITAESDIGGKVSLYDLTITESNFAYSDFNGAELESAIITQNRLIHSDFSSANLSEAELTENEMHGLTASGLTLRGADLRGSGLDGLDVRDIDLTGVMIDTAQQRVLLETIGIIVLD